ncbi:MAG: low molecular weight protein-tyrosine-phosphatase [Bacteroidota bacterium]
MKILMVCLGNICRSPMAEGILRNKLDERQLPATVDSAGTGNYHVGEAPDQRAISTAGKYGVDISGLAARQFDATDFDAFDRIYVMDVSNRRNVLQLAATDHHREKVQLLLDVLYPGQDIEVPDPWYGKLDAFEHVYGLLDTACDEVVDELESLLAKK